MSMKRREQWLPILDAEMKRWCAKSCDELVTELGEVQAYQVEIHG